MLKTKKIELVVDVHIECDICKELCYKFGDEDDLLGVSYADLSTYWGYGSPKDGEFEQTYMCEKCYDLVMIWIRNIKKGIKFIISTPNSINIEMKGDGQNNADNQPN